MTFTPRCHCKPGKLVEASAVSLGHQTPFNQQTPDGLPFFLRYGP